MLKMKYMKYLLMAAFLFCTVAQADGGRNYSGLPQNLDFQVLDPVLMPLGHISTKYLSLTQEETVNRYYLKMLDRYSTDNEHAEFAYRMHFSGCTTNLLGSQVLAIFYEQEFKNILPSASTDAYSRAGQLVRRIYKAALARKADRDGFRFYRDKLYREQMTEKDFVLQVVGSLEFKNGTAGWCTPR